MPTVTRPGADEAPAGLFRDLVITAARRPARTALGVGISGTTHVVVASALLLVALRWPTAVRDVATGPLVALALEPPPPPAPPMGGRPATSTPTARTVTSQPPASVVPAVETPAIEAPPVAEQPHAASAPTDGAEGPAAGDPDGTGEGAGEMGGVPGGRPGGCATCFGNGPVSDYDLGPQLVVRTQPVYPQEAFVKKIEGTVVLEIVIDAAGNVTSARITSSTPVFDRAATECVWQWKFKPARKQGRSVATLAIATVTFRIH